MDDTRQKDYALQDQMGQQPSNTPEAPYTPPVGQPEAPQNTVLQSFEPTVVMPAAESKTPVFFYLVFFITIGAFLFVSYLLFQSFTAKKETAQPLAVPVTPRPTATPIVISPTIAPTPVDSVQLNLRKLDGSDAVSDIETNMDQTDYAPLQEDLSTLDKEFNFSSKR